MIHRPLLTTGIAFAAGSTLVWIGLGPGWGWIPLWGGFFWAALRFRRSAAGNLFLLLLAFWTGVARAEVDRRSPPEDLSLRVTLAAQPVTLEGTVLSLLRWRERGRRYAGWFSVDRVREGEGWRPAGGRLWLELPAVWPVPLIGERLRLSGLLRAGAPEGRPGGFDEAAWLWRAGAVGRLSVADRGEVLSLPGSPSAGLRLRRGMERLRGRLRERARALLGRRAAPYFDALLLGEQEGVPPEARAAFLRSGTLHVLVVSGLHVGLIGGILFLLLALLRLPPPLRTGGVALILIGYCLLTGARIPTIRATVMALLFCAARLQGDAPSVWNGLGLAAWGILTVHPRALADPGFQLSFSAIAGIAGVAPLLVTGWKRVWSRLREGLRRSGRLPALGLPGSEQSLFFRRFSRGAAWVGSAAAVSAGAWLGTAPVLVWHFDRVVPQALWTNLVVVPWAAVLVAVGGITVAVGLVSEPAAGPGATCFRWLVEGLLLFLGAGNH
ncbi:MAG: hypothetical protein COV76_03535 [Candidatus Omnitrophica bacterium CG11_big_fil_rev_8_21_14_0_20_64_10]|nr:MAG: hypothetical protein COV76_03535 [Candidatus Omnitrophica bacterium CG11_big_fil_rev_8_21_14_0_20_64_10]